MSTRPSLKKIFLGYHESQKIISNLGENGGEGVLV